MDGHGEETARRANETPTSLSASRQRRATHLSPQARLLWAKTSRDDPASWLPLYQHMFDSAEAALVFTDFDLMSTWIGDMISDTIRVQCLDWTLSLPIQDAVRRSLGNAAVRDARAQAEVYATAAGLRIIGVQSLADPGLLTRDDDADEPAASPPTRATLLAAAPGGETGYDLTPQLVESTAQVEARFLAQ